MNKCEGCKWESGGWTVGIGPCHNCKRDKPDNFEPVEEPVSAKELIKQYLGIDPDMALRSIVELTLHRDDLLELVQKAEANERIRHRTQQVFKEWAKANVTSDDMIVADFVWHASARNLGYNLQENQ